MVTRKSTDRESNTKQGRCCTTQLYHCLCITASLLVTTWMTKQKRKCSKIFSNRFCRWLVLIQTFAKMTRTSYNTIILNLKRDKIFNNGSLGKCIWISHLQLYTHTCTRLDIGRWQLSLYDPLKNVVSCKQCMYQFDFGCGQLSKN